MLVARLMLLIAAFIWGSTFVAQRMSADIIGPFSFNALRFALGAIILLPVVSFFKDTSPTKKASFSFPIAAIIAGGFLFIGSALQQIGLAETTASKAGFITALYIVIVPIVGLFLGHRLSYLAIAGVVFATAGLFLMTLSNADFTIVMGDLLITISTLFWAGHILALSYLASRFPGIKLAIGQFIVCSLLSGITAFFYEGLTLEMVTTTLFAILYSGILSVGVGFTLQLIAQKNLPPTEASLLMSLEMVFSALTGYIVLGETLSTPEMWGAFLLSLGILLAQIPTSPRWSIVLTKGRV